MRSEKYIQPDELNVGQCFLKCQLCHPNLSTKLRMEKR